MVAWHYMLAGDSLAGVFPSNNTNSLLFRLAPVLKTIFHQCVISYTCSQSYPDGSVLKTIFHQCVISYTCSQSYSDGSVLRQSHQGKTGYTYMI